MTTAHGLLARVGAFTLAGFAAAHGMAERAADPCAAIAGKAYVAPAAALACLKSFPYNVTLANNVMEVVTKVTPFFTFEDWQKDTPAPFTEATSNLAVEFARIKRTKYKTDYDFNRDVYNVINRLDDGHTLWLPACYWAAFQNIAPTPLIALEKNGVQDIYVAPDAVEFIGLLGSNYTSYYDAKGFNYKKYAGAKVLTIDGISAWAYVNNIATTYSGEYIEHNIRVNSVFTNYRISNGAWSQRLGDFAGPVFPDKDSVTLSLIPVNSTKPETVKVDYRATYLGAGPFKDGPSYWKANCAATNVTNGVDYRGSSAHVKRALIEKKRRPIAEMSAAPVKAVGLPSPYLPSQPDVINGTGVIKAYVLPDKKTGALMVGSFGGNYTQFQNDTVAALAKFKAAKVQHLIVDTTGNGGGYVCLGEFLINALAGTKFGYAGFESATRAGPLARKIVESDIAQGIDYMNYSPNQWAFLNNTPQPANYNYMEPPTNFTINATKDAVSKRFYDICTPYDVKLPAEPFLPASKIIIVGNGECASTCALFTGVAYERLGIRVAMFGGNPGQPSNFNGMAGNQVLEWADLDSEIKTAGLKNDPLAPPDLLVNSNYRVNWRYAYSWQNKSQPLAFHVERATYRIPYTADTYMSPQNLWTYIAKTYLN
ncbi:peptidase family S41 protein [Ceratobasidium sp. AG-Ba]|nr:peptidase family S41 protein [Ceratobasidium sp. AG-Ba]